MLHYNNEHEIVKELTDWWKKSKASSLEGSVPFVTILQDIEVMREIVCLHMCNFRYDIIKQYDNDRIKLCEYLIEKIKFILGRHKFDVVHIMFNDKIYEYIYSYQDMKFKYSTKF